MAIRDRTQKLTYEEYQAFCDRPENASRIFELIDGEVVEKMPSFKPSRIGSRINGFIFIYLTQKETGYLTGADGGYKMPNGDVFNSDVGYISKERLPEEPAREVPVPPDLAVEVKSPTDRKRAMRTKAEKYIAGGTKLVWLVFPEEQLIEVYTPDEDVLPVGVDGALDGGTVLPGFTLKVSDIFATS